MARKPATVTVIVDPSANLTEEQICSAARTALNSRAYAVKVEFAFMPGRWVKVINAAGNVVDPDRSEVHRAVSALITNPLTDDQA
jgi:hypothetical protein